MWIAFVRYDELILRFVPCSQLVNSTTNAKSILMELDQTVNEISFYDHLDDNFDVNQLHSSTHDAVDAISKAVWASCDFYGICLAVENRCEVLIAPFSSF